MIPVVLIEHFSGQEWEEGATEARDDDYFNLYGNISVFYSHHSYSNEVQPNLRPEHITLRTVYIQSLLFHCVLGKEISEIFSNMGPNQFLWQNLEALRNSFVDCLDCAEVLKSPEFSRTCCIYLF